MNYGNDKACSDICHNRTFPAKSQWKFDGFLRTFHARNVFRVPLIRLQKKFPVNYLLVFFFGAP